MRINYTDIQVALQPKLANANINPESFLATDYLNHYNEIVMLLEMIPDMPELVEDTADWKPKSYNQHFEDSGFQAKDLAIEAFNNAPEEIKTAFLNVCGQLDQLIASTLTGLLNLNVIERGLSPAAQELIRQRVESTQTLLLQLNQVIHGKLADEEVIEIKEESIIQEPEDVQTQEDIDKLFD